MVDAATSAGGSQCLSNTTSSAFEQLRPRRKARRSCLNCQRSHKTCGNERPCESCVKRGMALKCVDGFRKPPKYLCDSPKAKKSGLHRPKPARREPQHEFIDPTLLQTDSPSPESDGFAEMSLFWEEKNNALFFSRMLQRSPSEGGRQGQSEENLREESYHSADDLSKDLFSGSPTIGTLIPSASNVNGCDGHSIKEVHADGSSFGFSISSGWSSTFFPCGMEEEIEEQKVKAMAAGGTECANFLAWGQGMGEGSRANWLF